MDLPQIILSLIGVVGLILMLFYSLRKLNRHISIGGGNKMRVLDRINLGRDGMLLVVSVCGKLMLVGVTSQRIEKICDLDVSEEEYFPLSEKQNATDFRSIFAAVLGRDTKPAQHENRFDLNIEKEETDGRDSEKTE